MALAGSDATWNEQRKSWRFPSGATLEFGHVENENSKYDYQGAAFAFVGFDELTQFTETQYEYIAFSRQRRRTDMARIGVPIRVRSTANPGGEGHGWVKRRFIDQRKPGVVFIPAKVSDNPGLDVGDYTASLMHLPDALRRQLLDGDWGVFEGAAYPFFDEGLHALEHRFRLPPEWDRFEFMDFGVTNPTAWHLAGTNYDGNIVVAEQYYEPGLVSKHAAEIRAWRIGGWQPRDEDGWALRSNPCFGDPSIKARTGLETKLGDPASVLTEFAEHGIGISPANNDRRAGYVRIAELLRPDPERRFPAWHPRAGELGSPRLFISARCTHLIEQLKIAPLLALDSGKKDAGEIVDPSWEQDHGHAHASLRYGVMSRPGASKEPEPPKDPREEMKRRRAARRLTPEWQRGYDVPEFVEL